MALNTSISWADHTWNPWIGCTKIRGPGDRPRDTGCAHCYMYRWMAEYRPGRSPAKLQRTAASTWKFPLSGRVKPGESIFTCSLSDFFHPAADAWRTAAWDIIRKRYDCPFIILTKRPELVAERLPDDWRDGYNNVWLLVSASTQARLAERWAILSQIPARVRGVSLEPLLELIRLDELFPLRHIEHPSGVTPFDRPPTPYLDNAAGLDWIIIGGESGEDCRPMHRSAPGIINMDAQKMKPRPPVFFKQWGGHPNRREGEQAKLYGRLLQERPSWSPLPPQVGLFG